MYIQGDRLNMPVFFWNLAKSDLSSVSTVDKYTQHFLQGTRKHGHV